LEHEGGFAGADGSADADREGPLGEVPVEGQFAIMEVPCMIEVFVGVGMGVAVAVAVAVAVGWMRFGHG
jgi:hypothetical protein